MVFSMLCAIMVSLTSTGIQAATVAFSGNVVSDFANPTFMQQPAAVAPLGHTGRRLVDMRWVYDRTTDTAFFGTSMQT